MQDVERGLTARVQRGIGARWEAAIVAPLLPHLLRRQPEPADDPIDQSLVVLAVVGFTQRDRTIAQAGSAAKPVIELVGEHGHVTEGAKRVVVALVLADEVRPGVIPVFEQDAGGLLEPQPAGAILHDVGIVRPKGVPLHILGREQAVADRGKAKVSQHTRAVNLSISLLLAGPVEIAVVEGIAGGGKDQFSDLFPLGGEGVSPRL